MKIKVYIDENKELVGVFPTDLMAAKVLAVGQNDSEGASKINAVCQKYKKRTYSNTLRKRIIAEYVDTEIIE